ncbi:MAG: outer membrane channel protein TolC [Gammaproteobacteria bacterium]|nr:MAG: outer membrane channel protein TolC [Gammaproteobacteria bacterium]
MRIKPLIIACLLGSLSLATSLKAESILDIYNLATSNDPQFLSQGAQLEASSQLSGQALSALLPNLSGSYNYSYSRGNSQSSFFTSATESSADGYSLTLRQSIYNYSDWVSYDQAKRRVEQAKVLFKSNKQDLIVRVSQTYFDVLSANDNLDFAEAEQTAIKQELEQTKQRYDVGLIAITDVHEAQARFDQSEADRIRAKNRLDNAHEALREITGRYTENLNKLNSNIPLLSPEPAQIDDWVQVARESNLNVIASNMDVYIARQDTKRRFGGHLPNVSLSASYSDTTTNPSGPVPDIGSYSVRSSLSVNVPLYSGGLTNARVKEGEALFKKASYDLESAMRSTIRNTRSSYLGVEASISGIKALQQSVVSQESALEATQAGFDVGSRTIVDVLLSTRSLYNARSSLSTARYDYVMAILKLKQAAGILTGDDLLEINKWMSVSAN